MTLSTLSSTLIGAKLRPEVRVLQDELVAWRRYLHQRPELGFKEEKTAAFIATKLTEWGIEFRSEVAKTGIVATIPGTRSGAVLAIRADMDALPVQELNDVPYRSQHSGQMHACGHDGHTAIALGVAKYLTEHRDFPGTVKLIFQPAEEGPGGAKPMIEADALKQPEVDAIIGLHLWNNLPLGTVGVRPGPLMAAVELFDLQITGKGGHGGLPHQTTDAIVVASQVVNALQTIVSRNLDPIDSAVVTVGQFNAGSARNVIAGSAQLSGTVRYFNPKYADYFADRFDRLIGGICAAHNAEYHLNYWRLYPATVNDARMAELVRSAAEQTIETPLGLVPECQTMGGEDMSFFLQQVPGCYFFVGAANADRDLAYPHHHPRFDFDETALGTGLEIFIRCIDSFFEQPTRWIA